MLRNVSNETVIIYVWYSYCIYDHLEIRNQKWMGSSSCLLFFDVWKCLFISSCLFHLKKWELPTSRAINPSNEMATPKRMEILSPPGGLKYFFESFMSQNLGGNDSSNWMSKCLKWIEVTNSSSCFCWQKCWKQHHVLRLSFYEKKRLQKAIKMCFCFVGESSDSLKSCKKNVVHCGKRNSWLFL